MEERKIKLEKPKILLMKEENNRIKGRILGVFQYIGAQWTEQFKQSFYYIENNEEWFSRKLKKMMRDRSSLWFDYIGYDQIKNDYKAVKR